ncbi:UTP11-like, U3 small nucleolar ribonucleoprotein, partial [Clydaea vesicula]
NVVKKRKYKERSQLSSRSHLGLLEKKSDYKLRAKDFHKKQDTLKQLKEKATNRNPDEFYFEMINSKSVNGVHVKERKNNIDNDFLKLLRTQDKGYISLQRSVNLKKVEKFKETVHFLDREEEKEDAELEIIDSNSEDDGSFSGKEIVKNETKTKEVSHTIFVDDERQVEKFNPSQYFQTPESLISRKFNRPKFEQIKDFKLPKHITKEDLEYNQRLKEKKVIEINKRLHREAKLKKVQEEIELQKNLMGKGQRRKIGVKPDGTPLYKWRNERKK